MKPSPPPATLAGLGTPPAAFQRLQEQLRHSSWICQGSVVARPLIRYRRGAQVKKGPYYLWTSKVQGKTVCIALSKTQYQLLGQAISAQRRLQQTLGRMQDLTLKTILQNVPGVRKRK